MADPRQDCSADQKPKELQEVDSFRTSSIGEWISNLSFSAIRLLPPLLGRIVPEEADAGALSSSDGSCLSSYKDEKSEYFGRRNNIVFDVGDLNQAHREGSRPALADSSSGFVTILRPEVSKDDGPNCQFQITCIACDASEGSGDGPIITGGRLTSASEIASDKAGALHIWRYSRAGSNAGGWCCEDANPERSIVPILCLSLEAGLLVCGHESRPENSLQARLARMPTIARRSAGPDLTLWRLGPGAESRPLSLEAQHPGHDTGNVTAVKVIMGNTPPGAAGRVVSVAMGEVKIWALEKGSGGVLRFVLLHHQLSRCAVVSGIPLSHLQLRGADLLATAASMKTVVVWELQHPTSPMIHQQDPPAIEEDEEEEGEALITELQKLLHPRDVYGVKFFVANDGDKDNEYLATTCHDQALRIWHVRSGICIRSTSHRRNPHPIISVDASSSGLVVSGSGNGQIALFHAMTGVRIRTMEGHKEAVTGVAFLNGCHTVASCSLDGTLRLWQVTSRKEAVRKLGALDSLGHTDAVYCIAFSRDNRLVATSSRDKKIKVWDCNTHACQCTLSGHTDFVFMVAFHPIEGILASASHDHSIKIWSLGSASHEHCCIQTIGGRKQVPRADDRVSHHCKQVTSVAFHPQGDIMASGSYDSSVLLYHRRHPSVSIPEDAVEGSAAQIALWVPFQQIQNHEFHIWDLTFCPRGEYLVTASWDEKVHVYTRKSFSPSAGDLLPKSCHAEVSLDCSAKVWAVAFQPVAKKPLFLTGSADSKIRVWSKPWGPWKLHGVLEGHTNTVTGLAWHPKGKKFVSSSFDKTVRLWVAEARDARKPTHGVKVEITFRSAGLWAAYSCPTTAVAWDYQLRSNMAGHACPHDSRQPQIAATGRTVITVGTQDGSVHMMDATDAGQDFVPYSRAIHVFEEVSRSEDERGDSSSCCPSMLQLYRKYPSSLMSLGADFSTILYNVLVKSDDAVIVKQMLDICQRNNISPLLANGPDGRPLMASVTAHQTVSAVMDCVISMNDAGSEINAAAMATDVGTCVVLMLVEDFPDQAVRLIDYIGLTKAHDVVYDPQWMPRRRKMRRDTSEDLITFERNTDLRNFDTKYPVGLWKAGTGGWRSSTYKNKDVVAMHSTFPNILGPMRQMTLDRLGVKDVMGAISSRRGQYGDVSQDLARYQKLENSFLHLACRSGEPQLLATPLGRAILNFKWQAYGQSWLFRHFVIYVLFLASLLLQTFCLASQEHAGGWVLTVDKYRQWLVLNCAASAATLIMSVVWSRCELRQAIAEGLKRYLGSGWNILDLVLLFLGYICGALGLGTAIFGLQDLEQSHEFFHDEKAHQDFVKLLSVFSALASFTACMKSFYFLRAYDRTSGLVRMVLQIAYDMRWLLLLLLIVMLGATFSFFVLMTINFAPETTVYGGTGRCSDDEWATLSETLRSLDGGPVNATNNYDDVTFGCAPPDAFTATFMHVFSMMLGGFEIDFFDTLGADFTWIGHLLFICYAILQMILLLNLLIALMGDSYEKVQENAYIESLAQRAALLVDIELSLGQASLVRQGFFPRYLHALFPKESVLGAGGKEWSGVTGTLRREMKAHITDLREDVMSKADGNREMLAECTEQIKHMRAEMAALAQKSYAPLSHHETARSPSLQGTISNAPSRQESAEIARTGSLPLPASIQFHRSNSVATSGKAFPSTESNFRRLPSAPSGP